ncbi:hypothetical protein [Caldimonas brevitalea]|uniref:Uncharacterized protein n=1 Tax=Caldimonas brevitalea TaxID=413882 RepID=A0A0G3BNR0_9BURK|nr:hypothetical protein [Caldimonas brevitalea]AKJ28185.1 hypothetical protein AAW51_1494 [Caldimonas brevitalea]
MKLRFWPSLLIFASSYFPLALVVIIKDLDPGTFWPQHPKMALAIIVSALLCMLALYVTVRSIPPGLPVLVTRVSNKSGELVAYTLPYMISFYRFDLGDWRTLLCLLLFLGMMFALSYRTRNILVNPVLGLVGYGLYDVQFKEGARDRQGLLLSRQEFRVGDRCHVTRLSNFLYFVKKVEVDE